MALCFLASKSDDSACRALKILEDLGQEVLTFDEKTIEIKEKKIAAKFLIGVFSSPNPKLILRGHLSRLASHRIMGNSPLWAKNCHLLIAVRQEFKENSDLVRMVKEWLKVAENFNPLNLSKTAPWGVLPTSPQRFFLYQGWVKKHLSLDPYALGIKFVPGQNNFAEIPPTEIGKIKQALATGQNKKLIGKIMRTARTTSSPVNTDVIIKTGLKLISLAQEKRVLIESSDEIEKNLSCWWKALSGETLKIIVPLCPAWTHDENGYTFCGLEENSKGVCYEMLAPELDYFLSFLKDLDVPHELLVWVADIEWLDLQSGTYESIQSGWTKERFMSTVEKQCQLVVEDLKNKKITADVKPLFSIFSEAEYLVEQAKQEEKYLKTLEDSLEARGYFINTLKLEAMLYKRQCGLHVDHRNPHPKIKDALVKDIVSHLAPLNLAQNFYRNSNIMFFLQSGPFTQLYAEVPYVAWRMQRKGAF